MKEILFSILVPAYKGAFLKECIDSILAQTYSKLELIIVDDASPEDLYSIVRKIDDPRIHYYRNKVGYGAYNVIGNWNKCLEYATGDFVICMGDDDKLKPNCLEEYKTIINKYPDKFIYHGWTEIIDENSNFTEITSMRPETESVYSLIWHRWDGRQQFIGDFCFNRIKLIENGEFYYLPLAWGSDDITASIASISGGIANTQKLVFQYRRNPHSISSGREVDIREKVYALCLEELWFTEFLKTEPNNWQDKLFWISLKKKIKEHYKKRKRGYLALDISSRLISSFYWLRNSKKYGLDHYDLYFSLFVGIMMKIRKKVRKELC